MNKVLILVIAMGLGGIVGCKSPVKTAGKAAVRGTVAGAKATGSAAVGTAKAVLGKDDKDRDRDKKKRR